MKLTLADLFGTDPEAAPMSGEETVVYRHYRTRCYCGRFAKWRGDRQYYNGWFDCYSYDLECSRCGVVTVECV